MALWQVGCGPSARLERKALGRRRRGGLRGLLRQREVDDQVAHGWPQNALAVTLIEVRKAEKMHVVNF